MQHEAVAVFELLNANETDEVVRLDTLLRIVVLHWFNPFVLILDVNLITKAAWERFQTGKAPVQVNLKTRFPKDDRENIRRHLFMVDSTEGRAR